MPTDQGRLDAICSQLNELGLAYVLAIQPGDYENPLFRYDGNLLACERMAGDASQMLQDAFHADFEYEGEESEVWQDSDDGDEWREGV